MAQDATPPPDEAARLACLASLSVLDSPPEPVFDQIVRVAADLCGTPIALVSLVDEQRQWFKASVGMAGVSETHRDLAFCAHAILADTLMEVPDAALDPRFAGNALVTGGPMIRFYAGAPITMPEGERMGTLSVIDQRPRCLTEEQRTALQGLARVVASSLLERRQRIILSRELQASEASYRRIVEGQSELISLATEEGMLSYVNPAYAQFFGMRVEEMLGRNLLDFVDEHDRATVQAHLREVVQAQSTAHGINRMVSADGRERWVAWTNRCIEPTAGGVPVVHSVGRDITEQRQAEQALAQNEARSRMLYEATPAMLHSIDLQGRLLNVSQTWLQRMGYCREEVIGRASAEFLTTASAQRAREPELPAFFESGRCEHIEYQMVRKDGSVIDVLLSAILERDASGAPVRSLAVVEDVTERNAATATLNETTHMLQLVLDGLPARISYWDANNCNRFANKAFLAWFGVEQRAITGLHARDVLGLHAYRRIEAQITAGLAGHYQQIEVTATDADGTHLTTDMRFIPDLRSGQVHGLFVLALDITAQRQAERDLADRESRFKLLVEGVRDYAIYMLDTQGQVATWNAGAQRNKGYEAAQVIGQPYSIFFTPEDVAAGRPAQALALAQRNGSFESEGWRVRGDGSRFWASALITAIRDEAGQLRGYAKVTRDLTEHKRQQALLVRVVELAPCAMLMVNARGHIVMVNAETETTFGCPRAELLGQPVEMLLPAWARVPDTGPPHSVVAHPSGRAMGAGRELRGRRRNGQEFPIEIGLSPIDSADGTSTLAAVFDITERQRQQALTEQALAEKETLLKEVYHRVKNNLQVVQSLLNLQRHALPEGLARDAIQDSVQRVRAMALVHEKLYQSGNLAAVSLRRYTRELIEQISEAHGVDRSRVTLHTEIAEIETGLDSAVPYGLLLTELVTNALKHAFPAGRGGAVRITLVRRSDGDLLTVADDGVGYRGDPGEGASTRRSASMGLQLADSLARQLGGELQSRSEGGVIACTLLTRL